MQKKWFLQFAAGALVTLLGFALVYQIPAVNQRLGWRLDAAQAYLRGWWLDLDAAPAPLPTATEKVEESTGQLQPSSTPSPTVVPTATSSPTPGPTATLVPTPTPLPETVRLPAPAWEKQDWNNCGPATLSLYLRTFGWEGDQYSISDLLKPVRGDRNVNVEELVHWVRNYAGWLNADFRVGGELEILKQFLANGIPIMIEEGYILETEYWPNDDRWSGHYLLLTGYDDANQMFTGQDSFLGADRQVSYEMLDVGWKSFNRVYIFLYLPHQEETVKSILGPHWDPEYNREQALAQSKLAVETAPEDPFAWFNLGSNLVYYERYPEAADAYDQARSLGLPQRMFRYQFGPFIAYFHSFRVDELMSLTEYALRITKDSEEAHLWRGWGFYRQGDSQSALDEFYLALEVNPNYEDAKYAINFVTGGG